MTHVAAWIPPMDRRASQWCILRTSPRRTIALAESLADAGFEVWTPACTLRTRRPRSQAVTKRNVPIMPTFVFARAGHLHELAALSSMPAYDHPQFSIFRHAGRIPLVADAEVAGARAEEEKARDAEERASAREHRYVFEKGTRVRVNSDAFTGLEGVIEDGRDGRAALVTFGGSIRFSISTYLLTSDELQADLPRAAA